MKGLTERQQEVLNFVSEYKKTHTYSPTIREMADYFSISVKGAHDHISALKKKGLIRQEIKRSRTIELIKTVEETGNSEQNVSIPLLGSVAAGKPILAEENQDGFVVLHRSMLKKNRDYFALRVRGDSMEGKGIMDGDTAIIEKRETVKNGEIAVVMVDDAVTIKTFYRENARIRLQPANPRYSPIYYSQDLRVLGRLAHIVRSY
ncbi:LexA repressor [Spirochaetia bacterium]|nr:LexA repressor [Spirochaetia bacterium]